MHKFSKRAQNWCSELSNGLDKDYGLLALPVGMVLMLVSIPFMFIEMVTWTKAEVPPCDHRIDNKRANYRKDPRCSRCGIPLCTSRSEYGGVCLRERGHSGLHCNPNLRRNSEWRSQGSTLLNNEAE